jgi:hypothetical protein
MATLFAVLRIIGMLFLAHALMLLGADEITSLEMGGVRYIRPLDAILVLYGADVKPFLMTLPEWLQGAAFALIALPGWAVFAGVGGLFTLLFRVRD